MAAFDVVIDSYRMVRCGFHLFHEVRYLLETGHPIAEAAKPTLDIYVKFIRTCMSEATVSWMEIPPASTGFTCATALTHE